MQINVLNKIDIYGLITDMLVQDPNVSRFRNKTRYANGSLTHRDCTFIFQVYSTHEHYSLAMKQRKSINDDWSPVWRLIIPKNE